jgi:hypothetical protein
MDEYSTKELEKIVEPIDEEDYQEDGQRNQYHYNSGNRRIDDPFRTTEYGKVKKNKRKKRKQSNIQPTNS